MLVYFFRCHGFAIRLARFIWMSESAHDHYFPTNSRSIWHWFYRKYRFLEKELINCHFRHYRLSVYYNETSKSLSSSSLKCVDRRKIPNRKHHNRYIQINVGATDHNFEMIRKRPWFAIRLRAIHPDTREDTYLLFRYTFHISAEAFYHRYRLEKEIINCHFHHYRLSVQYNDKSSSSSSSSLLHHWNRWIVLNNQIESIMINKKTHTYYFATHSTILPAEAFYRKFPSLKSVLINLSLSGIMIVFIPLIFRETLIKMSIHISICFDSTTVISTNSPLHRHLNHESVGKVR